MQNHRPKSLVCIMVRVLYQLTAVSFRRVSTPWGACGCNFSTSHSTRCRVSCSSGEASTSSCGVCTSVEAGDSSPVPSSALGRCSCLETPGCEGRTWLTVSGMTPSPAFHAFSYALASAFTTSPRHSPPARVPRWLVFNPLCRPGALACGPGSSLPCRPHC